MPGMSQHTKVIMTKNGDLGTRLQIFVSVQIDSNELKVSNDELLRHEMQSLARFYTDLDTFFAEKTNSAEVCIDGYGQILDTVVPLDLDQVWQRWFTVQKGGGEYVSFLHTNQGFIDQRVSPWVAASETTEAKRVEQISGEGGHMPQYADLKPNMHRILVNNTPIKLAIPLLPKYVESTAIETIKSVTSDSIVVTETTETPFFAVDNLLVKKLERTKEGTCIKLYLKVVVRGTLLPKTITEQKTRESLTQVYSAWAKSIAPQDARSEVTKVVEELVEPAPARPVGVFVLCVSLVLGILGINLVTLGMVLSIISRKQ
jgi:hypothetical protein